MERDPINTRDGGIMPDCNRCDCVDDDDDDGSDAGGGAVDTRLYWDGFGWA